MEVPILAVKTTKFSTFKPLYPVSPPKTHTVHLSRHPAYPPRAPVQCVDWNVPEPEYSPVDFTHPVVIKNDRSILPNGWADPAEWTEELQVEVSKRRSNAVENGGKVIIRNGRPWNPLGRTGMIGRGLLGKYGANHAADPLVTRFDPQTGRLQMVAIQRADTKDWAIPGGMVDAGEQVSLTLKREFMEEARNLDKADSQLVSDQLEALFASGGVLVFTGVVNDPRNTDHAWMETTCVHFHIENEFLSQHLTLQGGDDAVKAKWLTISDDEADFSHLYASHRAMVVQALCLNPHKFGRTLAQVYI